MHTTRKKLFALSSNNNINILCFFKVLVTASLHITSSQGEESNPLCENVCVGNLAKFPSCCEAVTLFMVSDFKIYILSLFTLQFVAKISPPHYGSGAPIVILSWEIY